MYYLIYEIDKKISYLKDKKVKKKTQILEYYTFSFMETMKTIYE